MKTIFRKVMVKRKKKDIPEDGQYSTDLGYIEVFCGNWVSDDYPEWYLEEIELPSDDITNRCVTKLLNKFVDDDSFDFGFRCAKWMRDFVLAATPK